MNVRRPQLCIAHAPQLLQAPPASEAGRSSSSRCRRSSRCRSRCWAARVAGQWSRWAARGEQGHEQQNATYPVFVSGANAYCCAREQGCAHPCLSRFTWEKSTRLSSVPQGVRKEEQREAALPGEGAHQEQKKQEEEGAERQAAAGHARGSARARQAKAGGWAAWQHGNGAQHLPFEAAGKRSRGTSGSCVSPRVRLADPAPTAPTPQAAAKAAATSDAKRKAPGPTRAMEEQLRVRCPVSSPCHG